VILEEDVRNMKSAAYLSVEILPGADHSLTLRDSQQRVVNVVRRWTESLEVDLSRMEPAAGAEAGVATASFSISH
jgi:hypothetical protein